MGDATSYQRLMEISKAMDVEFGLTPDSDIQVKVLHFQKFVNCPL